MAQAKSKSHGVKKSAVEQDLTCSLCLDFYMNPKSLPCLHTYCKRCIADYIQSRKKGQSFPCPLCKKKTKWTAAENLPSNFFVLNMLERYDEQRNVELICLSLSV